MSRIALGIDPGSRLNCGWALVTEADEDGPRRVWRGRAGVIAADGREIRQLLRSYAPCGLAAVGYEYMPRVISMRNTFAALTVIGRWLGALEDWWGDSEDTSSRPPVVQVKASDWQPQYVGDIATPRTVIDPETGERRKLLDVEKRAAKATREETYRIHAVRQLGLDPALPADAAAAAWVACYAMDHMPETPAPTRRKRR